MKWSKRADGCLVVTAPSGRVLAAVWPTISPVTEQPTGVHRGHVVGRDEWFNGAGGEVRAIAWAEAELSRLAADLAGAVAS